MRARFQNSYHEQLMTIECNIKDHPQLKYSSKSCFILCLNSTFMSPFSKRDNVYRTQKFIHFSYIEQDTSFKKPLSGSDSKGNIHPFLF